MDKFDMDTSPDIPTLPNEQDDVTPGILDYYAHTEMAQDDVLFLYILHGDNTTNDLAYFKYTTKMFQNILMYAKPHAPIHSEDLVNTKFKDANHALSNTPGTIQVIRIFIYHLWCIN